MIGSLLRASRRWAGRFTWWRYRAVDVDDIPETLRSRIVYVVGGDEPWCAAFMCPCGCSERIELSLMKDDKPSWRLSVDESAFVTLAPSIWRTRGCRAHFFLRGGRIRWVPPMAPASVPTRT